MPFSAVFGAVEAVPISGFVSWWVGDGHTRDLISGNDGMLVNGASYAPGLIGEAFSCVGPDDYVRVAAPANLPVGNAPRTMELWFKTAVDLSSATESALVQYGTPENAKMFGLITSGNAPGRLYFYGHNRDLASISQIPVDTWCHGAVTYDGTSLKLYFNGQLEASKDYTLETELNADGLTIGHRGPGSNWTGLIDDVAIYRRVLSDVEIAQIYAAGNAGKRLPPIITSIRQSPANAQAVICWNGQASLHYEVQYCDSLIANQWLTLLSGVLGTGDTNCVNDAFVPGQLQRFYRIATTNVVSN
ncbi:MAG: LamG domain-containing protein [Anaerolineales bacterium]|nr:LamG domain-containing protein [Anaerolineales bacterium]